MNGRDEAEGRRPIVRLSRRWQIAASHRLHAGAYDEARNRDVYGKCNNPFGHGHNYTVEVTMGGPVDRVTGMVTNLADLDRFAELHLMRRFDHQNLNALEEFRHLVPTTESFAVVLERIFRAYPHARLERVHVEETARNAFDLLTAEGRRAPFAARER